MPKGTIVRVVYDDLDVLTDILQIFVNSSLVLEVDLDMTGLNEIRTNTDIDAGIMTIEKKFGTVDDGMVSVIIKKRA